MDIIKDIQDHWVHIPLIMGMVLVYALLLNLVLFRPIRSVLSRRAKRSEDAEALSKKSRAELEARFAEYEEAVLDARRRGTGVKEAARQEVSRRREEILGDVRREVGEVLSKAEADLGAEVDCARKDIEACAPDLAEQAVSKVLCRRSPR